MANAVMTHRALTATVIAVSDARRLKETVAALAALRGRSAVRTILISLGTNPQPPVDSQQDCVAIEDLVPRYLNNAVASLRLSSLPSIAWWRGVDVAVLPDLAGLVDRLVLDAEDPTETWSAVAGIASLTVVSDLRWTRLTRWRNLMAQFFDVPAVRAAIGTFTTLEIAAGDVHTARHSPEIVEESDAEELVELGSGTASKTRALLYAMAGNGSLRRYVPFDFDPSVVEACAAELIELYPGLEVHGVVGDFGRDLACIPAGDQRLFAFLGGTIGNLLPDERAAFLGGLREQMDEDDRLVIGTDLVKDRSVLEAAYNDRAGVTAEFNRNILRVINSGLDADFDPEAFEHVAFFDEANSWIEMRLRANGAQQVRIVGADLEVTFADGEEIRTEISAKFTREAVERELKAADLRLDEFFTDGSRLFGLAFARAR